MKSSHRSAILRVSIFGIISAGIFAAANAPAVSFHNPGSQVSSGDTPFSLVCSFTEYGNVGTYSIPIQKAAAPAHASSVIKAAQKSLTTKLAADYKSAKNALSSAVEDEREASDNGGSEIADIHSIKGSCRWSAS